MSTNAAFQIELHDVKDTKRHSAEEHTEKIDDEVSMRNSDLPSASERHGIEVKNRLSDSNSETEVTRLSGRNSETYVYRLSDMNSETEGIRLSGRNSETEGIRLSGRNSKTEGIRLSGRNSKTEGIRLSGRNSKTEGITEDVEKDGHSPDQTDGGEEANVFTAQAYAQMTTNNQYQIRKMAAQTLMDVALMMANISQLRTIVSLGESLVQYYTLLMTFTIFSLVCQMMFAIQMFIIFFMDSDQRQKQDFYNNLKQLEESKGVFRPLSAAMRQALQNQKKDLRYGIFINRLNHCTMLLVFLITVTNMLITGFGIHMVAPSP